MISVNLSPETCRVAFETYLASLKRALNTAKQPAFKPIIEKDIAAMQVALGSIETIATPVAKK